jgi:hypothetical protein
MDTVWYQCFFWGGEARQGRGSASPLDDLREFLRPLTDRIAQRLGKARIVEDTDALSVQKRRHPFGVARSRQRTRHHTRW